jgi:hypothetical protein
VPGIVHFTGYGVQSAQTMPSGIFVVTCAVLSAVVSGQLMPIRVYVSGDVTVTTSDSLARTAVSVTGRVRRESTLIAERKEFAFCITHPRPIAAKLNYRGKAIVVYQPLRNETAIAKAVGPEQILPALAVLQSDGESRFFLAEGQPYPHPPNERSVGRVTTFRGVNVIRQDYVDRDGSRRGSDAASCFATEG